MIIINSLGRRCKLSFGARPTENTREGGEQVSAKAVKPRKSAILASTPSTGTVHCLASRVVANGTGSRRAIAAHRLPGCRTGIRNRSLNRSERTDVP